MVLDIRATGSLADVIRQVRDVPARVIPFAASTALTRVAQQAVPELQDEMRRVFEGGPTRYTLNSLRIVPSTIDTLRARVAVKDQAPANAVRPENYLLPQTDGGLRREKRFESALRRLGLLARGEQALPAGGLQLDAQGNVRGTTIRALLRGLQSIKPAATGKRRVGKALRNQLFVGAPTVGRGAGRRIRAGAIDGIYRREGSDTDRGQGNNRARALFIFTRRASSYRPRFGFEGVVAGVARERFAAEFDRALQSIQAKRTGR